MATPSTDQRSCQPSTLLVCGATPAAPCASPNRVTGFPSSVGGEALATPAQSPRGGGAGAASSSVLPGRPPARCGGPSWRAGSAPPAATGTAHSREGAPTLTRRRPGNVRYGAGALEGELAGGGDRGD